MLNIKKGKKIKLAHYIRLLFSTFIMLTLLANCGGVGSNNNSNQTSSLLNATANLTDDSQLIKSFSVSPIGQESIVYNGIFAKDSSGNNTISINAPISSDADLVVHFVVESTVQYITVGNNRVNSGDTIHFTLGSTANYIAWTSPQHFSTYKVSITGKPLDIESFALVGTDGVTYPGIIANGTIRITMPETAIGNIYAQFSLADGDSLKVGDVPQISGQTSNTFVANQAVIYALYANDKFVQNYSVIVSTSSGLVTSFALGNDESHIYAGVISGHDINVTIPYSKANLIVYFTARDDLKQLTNGNQAQISGQTSSDFAAGQTLNYIAWLDNTHYEVYTVHILSLGSEIESFAIIGTDGNSYNGVISNYQIQVMAPANVLGNIRATFETDGATSVTVESVEQVSGETYTNFSISTPVTYKVCNKDNNCNNYVVTVNSGALTVTSHVANIVAGKSLVLSNMLITNDGKFAYGVDSNIGLATYQINTDNSIKALNLVGFAYGYSVALDPINSYLAVNVNNSGYYAISVYNMAQPGNVYRENSFTENESQINYVAISPTIQGIIYADNVNMASGKLSKYTLDQSKSPWTIALQTINFTSNKQMQASFTISPNGRFIYWATNSGSGKQDIYVIDANTLSLVTTIPLENTATDIKISTDGSVLYTATVDSKTGQSTLLVYYLDTQTGTNNEMVQSIPLATNSTRMGISLNNLYVLSSSNITSAVTGFIIKGDGSVVYANDKSGNHTWLTQSKTASSLAVSPSGKYVYVSNNDGTFTTFAAN